MARKMEGTRYYALLSGDRLKLFKDMDTAQFHQDPAYALEWEYRPAVQYFIYRNSKFGLVDENQKEQTLKFLVQDNQYKMK